MDKQLQKLQYQLDEMEQKIPFLKSKAPEISKATVGWHLDHDLRVILAVISGLENSEPQAYKRSFSWKKKLVFLLNKIPRGKARAPRRVIPDGEISAEELEDKIKTTRKKLNSFQTLPENAFFEHPFFGHLRKEETPKFLVIHTEHHLKIVRDILKDK
ncbi:DUF1569 domain-containing protein [Salinimicrobium oceani]|uniref:DUF1569 domain-containing protein n=1 Tax=Salinimicrobium oceani TaxID=2722702 RepID=A0ABX1CYL7_9FLAO|nr:DUF1569 domain-containing protein [Salinimicrobium oceani]NJW53359.1 DUF1569 domain-containing protein [Salinimicrobium oceani]